MKFNVIYADPAWTYDDKALAGNRGAGCKYSLMTEEALYALPVNDLASANCVLFLWTTFPKLAEGLECGRRWGFTYKTCAFTWVKPSGPFGRLLDFLKNRGNVDAMWCDQIAAVSLFKKLFYELNTLWFIGMGRWTRSNAEVCLLFVKGKPKRVDAGVNQIICAPRLEHSAKPPETRDRIVRLCGDVPRVELFAREHALGCIALGNEIDGRDLRDSIPETATRLSSFCPCTTDVTCAFHARGGYTTSEDNV